MRKKTKKSGQKRKSAKRTKPLRRKFSTKKKSSKAKRVAPRVSSTKVPEPQMKKEPLKVGPVANTPFRELIVNHFPNLRGYEFAEIIGILEANGVKVEVEKKFFSDNTVACLIDEPSQGTLSSYPEKKM